MPSGRGVVAFVPGESRLVIEVISNLVGKSPKLDQGGNLEPWRGEGGKKVEDEKGGLKRVTTEGGISPKEKKLVGDGDHLGDVGEDGMLGLKRN